MLLNERLVNRDSYTVTVAQAQLLLQAVAINHLDVLDRTLRLTRSHSGALLAGTAQVTSSD